MDNNNVACIITVQINIKILSFRVFHMWRIFNNKDFDMSVVSDKFPVEWKVARIVPIFKKGQRSMLDTYRPNSVLPVVSKLMEKILYNQTFDYLRKQNLGFRQLHSRLQLLHF